MPTIKWQYNPNKRTQYGVNFKIRSFSLQITLIATTSFALGGCPYQRPFFIIFNLQHYYIYENLFQEFLAKNKVVHRDLAARNVLVALDHTVKIADFGYEWAYNFFNLHSNHFCIFFLQSQ